jgi:glycosyltransferase EpsD
MNGELAMKILYVTTISNTVNAFLIPHIRMLIEQGHQVDVAFNIGQEVSHELNNLGCKVHIIEFQRSPLKKENYLAYKKLKMLVIKEQYELIHTHTPIASLITRLACRHIPNLKMLYTAHGFHFYKEAPLKNWLFYYSLEKICAMYTDAIITINEEDYISAKRMRCKRMRSVYKVHGIGVDLRKFSNNNSIQKKNLRKQYGLKDKDFILFYAAELNYNKHQDLLINVVNRLKVEIPNIKLLLAGEGSLREKYEEKVNHLGLEKNIKFLGYRKDIPNFLKLSDIGVSASRREGLPVNVMEAMGAGLPLVVTDCRGNRDLVKTGENGFVIRLEDIEQFSNAIIALYRSKNLRLEFSSKSTELIKNYSIDNVIAEIEMVYLQNM